MKDKPSSEKTLLEDAAISAMQGLAANPFLAQLATAPKSELSLASLAVDMAEALIKELKKR